MAKGNIWDKLAGDKVGTQLHVERKDNDQIVIASVAQKVEQEETTTRSESHAAGDCQIQRVDWGQFRKNNRILQEERYN